MKFQLERNEELLFWGLFKHWFGLPKEIMAATLFVVDIQDEI